MEENHEEFVRGITRLLEQRPGCNVMVVIHGIMGVEIMVNFLNPAIEFGMLDLAKLTIANRIQEMTRIQNTTRTESIAEGIQQHIDATTGKKDRMN